MSLVIHSDPSEVSAIVDCLERKVAQIIEDVRAEEEGRPPQDVSSPPPRARTPRTAVEQPELDTEPEVDTGGADEVREMSPQGRESYSDDAEEIDYEDIEHDVPRPFTSPAVDDIAVEDIDDIEEIELEVGGTTALDPEPDSPQAHTGYRVPDSFDDSDEDVEVEVLDGGVKSPGPGARGRSGAGPATDWFSSPAGQKVEEAEDDEEEEMMRSMMNTSSRRPRSLAPVTGGGLGTNRLGGARPGTLAPLSSLSGGLSNPASPARLRTALPLTPVDDSPVDEADVVRPVSPPVSSPPASPPRSPPSSPPRLKKSPGHSPESRAAASVAAAAAKEIGDLRRRVGELENVERELSETRFSAKRDRDALVDAERRADAAEARVGTAEDKLTAVESKAAQAESRAAQAEARVQDAESRVQDAESRVHAVEAEATELRREVTNNSAGVEEALERELAAATEKATGLERELESVRGAMRAAETRAKTAETRAKTSEAQRDAAEEVAAEAKEAASVAEANFAELSEATARREAEIASLKSSIASGGDAASRAAALETALTQEKEARASVEQKLTQTEAALKEVRESLAEADAARVTAAGDATAAGDRAMAATRDADEAKARAVDAETALRNAEAARDTSLKEKEEAEARAEVARAAVAAAEDRVAAAETALQEKEKASTENAMPDTATEIAGLIDDLRRRATAAELARNEAVRRAETAEASVAQFAERASRAENLVSQVDEAAAKALERADAAESAVQTNERNTHEVLAAMEGVSERDMASVARAEAERSKAAETRVVALEQKLKTAAESRAELSRLLAEAKAECAEHRGSASAATEALEEAFASARAVSGREASAREAQARAEARLAAAGAETAAAEERAARADDLEIRAQTAEARLESQAREGARAVARAQAEASEWRAKAQLRERELEAARASADTAASIASSYVVTSSASKRASMGTTRDGTGGDENANAYGLPPPLPPSSVLSVKNSPAKRFHNMTSPYARQYHDFSVERGAGGDRPTPALLTADFLDSLGSRLSSVRELLASDQVQVVKK